MYPLWSGFSLCPTHSTVNLALGFPPTEPPNQNLFHTRNLIPHTSCNFLLPTCYQVLPHLCPGSLPWSFSLVPSTHSWSLLAFSSHALHCLPPMGGSEPLSNLNCPAYKKAKLLEVAFEQQLYCYFPNNRNNLDNVSVRY